MGGTALDGMTRPKSSTHKTKMQVAFKSHRESKLALPEKEVGAIRVSAAIAVCLGIADDRYRKHCGMPCECTNPTGIRN